MKSSRLHIKYREDKIFALGSRDIYDYVVSMILKDSEAEDKRFTSTGRKRQKNNLIYSVLLRDGDAICNSSEEEEEEKHKSPRRENNVHLVSHKMYSQHFLISIKMSTCSRNSSLKKCYIYNLYICI